MTQDERRVYLIQNLLREQEQYCTLAVPQEGSEQKKLLRALMNVRMPRPISEEFLQVQDEYLQTERDRIGVTDSRDLPGAAVDDRLVLWQGDITTLKTDAIVNAANSQMLGCFFPLHGCIDNMIHSKSGIQLRLFCSEIMKKQGHEEPAGQAKITPAFNLPCRYIMHTVGPIITGRVTKKDERLLASCYRACMTLAQENGCQSVAFCCISTGEFRFPNELAAQIAIQTVKTFLDENDAHVRVIFNVFKDKDLAMYKKFLEKKA